MEMYYICWYFYPGSLVWIFAQLYSHSTLASIAVRCKVPTRYWKIIEFGQNVHQAL